MEHQRGRRYPGPEPSTGGWPRGYPYALADPQCRLASVEFDDAFQRARIVVLQRFRHDRTALRVPIGNADYVAGPVDFPGSVVANRGRLTDRKAAGELLFRFRANNTPPPRTKNHGRLFRL